MDKLSSELHRFEYLKSSAVEIGLRLYTEFPGSGETRDQETCVRKQSNLQTKAPVSAKTETLRPSNKQASLLDAAAALPATCTGPSDLASWLVR